MPILILVSCDNTTPVVGGDGIGRFKLFLTLSTTPDEPVLATLECSPTDMLMLANPYFCTDQVQELDMVTTNTVNSPTSFVVQVTCAEVTLCQQIWASPPGEPCPDSGPIDCLATDTATTTLPPDF